MRREPSGTAAARRLAGEGGDKSTSRTVAPVAPAAPSKWALVGEPVSGTSTRPRHRRDGENAVPQPRGLLSAHALGKASSPEISLSGMIM